MRELEIIVEPGKQELFIIHEVDAPRELVFKAYTDPKLYEQWIGPRGLKTHLDKFESKNGGSWRYVQKDDEGHEFAFHGVNHEIKTPERIIGTFEFEGLPERGHVLLQTIKFYDLHGGGTKIESQSVFQSVEDRDGMVATGMEVGVRESYKRLDELVERIKLGL